MSLVRAWHSCELGSIVEPQLETLRRRRAASVPRDGVRFGIGQARVGVRAAAAGVVASRPGKSWRSVATPSIVVATAGGGGGAKV